MPKRSRRREKISDEDLAFGRTTVTGKHVHTAEIHGEAETLGLREWAKRSVLSGASPR